MSSVKAVKDQSCCHLESLTIKLGIFGVLTPEVGLGHEEGREEYLGQARNGDQEYDEEFFYLPKTDISDHLNMV